MAQSASVAKLSVRHEAILHFLIANPSIPKWEVAQRFNVTEAWLSIVCNSQAFLEARARLTDEVFHETVIPLREKIIVAADRALDRMNALIPMECDLDKVRKSAESVLAACGFTSGAAPSPGTTNTQINNYFGQASTEVLARAREKIGLKQAPLLIDHVNGISAQDFTPPPIEPPTEPLVEVQLHGQGW